MNDKTNRASREMGAFQGHDIGACEKGYASHLRGRCVALEDGKPEGKPVIRTAPKKRRLRISRFI